MTNARHQILTKLRETKVSPSKHPVSPLHQQNLERSNCTLREQFVTQCRANRMEVHHAAQGHWQTRLIELAQENDLKCWWLGAGGPLDFVVPVASDLAAIGASIQYYDQPYETLRSELFAEGAASLTTCRAAIAETGTLILVSSPQEPRMLSLLPDVHVVLVNETDLYASFQDFVDEEYSEIEIPLPTNLLFISGPSKTADIQQTLAYGAHGPKRVIVLLVSSGQHNDGST